MLIVLLNLYIMSVIFSFGVSFLFMFLFVKDLQRSNRSTLLLQMMGYKNPKGMLSYLIPLWNIVIAFVAAALAISYRMYLNGKIEFNAADLLQEALDRRDKEEAEAEKVEADSNKTEVQLQFLKAMRQIEEEKSNRDKQE